MLRTAAMGWRGRVVSLILGSWMACGAGVAQRYATDPLQAGNLVIWQVVPAPPPRPTADQVRATLHTSTAGTFGQSAGAVGQTAGDYGGGPGGTPVRSQPAGSAGQSAGSFGHSLDTIADAGRQDASNAAAARAALP